MKEGWSENEKLFWPFLLVGFIALVCFLVYMWSRNYDECLAAGHTSFYCLTSGG